MYSKYVDKLRTVALAKLSFQGALHSTVDLRLAQRVDAHLPATPAGRHVSRALSAEGEPTELTLKIP